MASELQEMMAELNKAASEEKKKFVEKVRNDDDIQSMFSQLAELKKETDAKEVQVGEEKKSLIDELSAVADELEEGPRIPRKKGQPAGSKKHSDLYTDENPKGTIHGLGFKDVKTAEASVKKIENSGKSHAHKIQAAIAMEQRARVMGKTAEAAVYRRYIEKMKKITKQRQKKNEETESNSERLEDTQVQTEDSEEQEDIQQEEIFVTKTVEQLGKQNLVNEQSEKDLETEFRKFKDLVSKQLSSLGGGGEVRLEFLDDVDRTSAKVDGKALVYQASTGKFIGGEAGGGVSSGVLQQEGSTDNIVLDGTDASATDAGDSITQEIGSEDYVLGDDGYLNDDGFEYVNDNNTSTELDTPNTFVTLTNARKNAGDPVSGSLSQYLPKRFGTNSRIVRIWDDTEDKFFFNELERKDALIMRFGLKINPQVHNIRVVVKLLVTLKHGGSFGLECPATILGPSGAGVSYDPEFITTFFVGDLEGYKSTDTFAQVQASADGPCTIEDFDILTIKV
jgi:hypothetical protein